MQLKRLFDRFDDDGNGSIDAKEFIDHAVPTHMMRGSCLSICLSASGGHKIALLAFAYVCVCVCVCVCRRCERRRSSMCGSDQSRATPDSSLLWMLTPTDR